MSNLPGCYTLDWSGWCDSLEWDGGDKDSTAIFRETVTGYMCSVVLQTRGLFAFVAFDPKTAVVCALARGRESEMLSVANIFAEQNGGWAGA